MEFVLNTNNNNNLEKEEVIIKQRKPLTKPIKKNKKVIYNNTTEPIIKQTRNIIICNFIVTRTNLGLLKCKPIFVSAN